MTKQTINGELILDNKGEYLGTYKYHACQMYTDGSYVLNVYGNIATSLKLQVKKHVEDLHSVVVTTITGG